MNEDATKKRKDAAAWCGSALGWSFTPLNGKRPTLNAWQAREHETPDEAIAWCEAGNIGLRTGATSGVVVVDVDEGGSIDHLDLPDTVTAVTGSGGRHYYFKTDQPTRNSAGKLAEHVDVRGDGGQVVFPGSVHPTTGNLYDWIAGREPWTIELAELPGNVRDIIEADREKREAAVAEQRRITIGRPEANDRLAMLILKRECEAVAATAEGGRNDTLNTAAFTLGRLVGGDYLNATEVELELRRAADACGLDWHEAHQTIASGIEAGRQNPRTLPTRNVRHYEDETQDGDNAPEALPAQRFTLDCPGNADRFAFQHGDDVFWCEQLERWLIWNGRKWADDKIREIHRRAEQTTVAIKDEVEAWPEDDREPIEKWAAKTLKSAAGRKEIVETTKHRRAISEDAFDQTDWLIACRDGMIDLRNGELNEHRRENLNTRLCPCGYEPDVEPTQWLNFLNETTGGDDEMIGAMQRLAGYWLTGDISEQILPIFYGEGANGKSVFLDTLGGILGDYGGKAADTLLTATQNEQHPTEVAELRGRRFVLASETEEGRKLRVGLVKQITGDATLKGRFMRQDFFEFRRTCKVVLATNNKPVIGESSHAVWRRLRLFPFENIIPEERRDAHLTDKLRQEWAAILGWMVRGCIDWRKRKSLDLPARVVDATASYKAESDIVATFIDERCIRDANAKTSRADISQAFARWAELNGEKQITARALNARMRAAGCKETWTSGETRERAWQGIAIAYSGEVAGNYE